MLTRLLGRVKIVTVLISVEIDHRLYLLFYLLFFSFICYLIVGTNDFFDMIVVFCLHLIE